jgi:hypothetical protein
VGKTLKCEKITDDLGPPVVLFAGKTGVFTENHNPAASD